MMETEGAPSIPQSEVWDTQPRTVSEGSLAATASSEQLALIGFAHRLHSVSSSNDPGITDENDMRKEARLLMSLSCVTPSNDTINSGRITPPSDESSCYSGDSSSRHRDSFTFSCPSLSLENPSRETRNSDLSITPTEFESSNNTMESTPAALLERVLKVDDRNALRLSSEAMARNVMQSYEKAIQWRLKSWAGSLSRVLVDKEKELRAGGMASEENLRMLCESSEAMLIVQLREISTKIRVKDACTNFKVLPRRVSKFDDERASKRQRLDAYNVSADGGLGETDYEYSVAYLLSFEIGLNIQAPGVGNVSIDLQIPGSMKGTFLSLEDGYEELTSVLIDVNTDILASMIEKSSRMVVRSTVEAIFKENGESERVEEGASQEATTTPQGLSASGLGMGEAPKDAHVRSSETTTPSISPKRKLSDDHVSDVVVITPRETSSPSSFEDSDNEDKPVILSIPDNFSSDRLKAVLTPHPSRPGARELISSFATRLPAMKKSKALPNVVTPSKTVHHFVEGKGPGPNLPTLVEVVLQLRAK